jgi:hypothetical protein
MVSFTPVTTKFDFPTGTGNFTFNDLLVLVGLGTRLLAKQHKEPWLVLLACLSLLLFFTLLNACACVNNSDKQVIKTSNKWPTPRRPSKT